MDIFMAGKNSRKFRMKKLCIIGLGWLGKQLVDYFVELDCELIGLNKTIYPDLKIPQFEFNLNNLDAPFPSKLQRVDFFIITLPPSSSDHYAGQMQLLFNKIQQFNPTPKIIYTSSTSVYGNQQGIVDEKSEIMPETENAKEIVKVEHSLIQLFEQQSIILRLSGLMGINRHPIRFLSGKINVSKPYAPVNLIHAKDIIKLIAVLIELEKDGIFNLSIPDHPTKNDYYTACCYKIGIPIPRFNLQDQTKGKIIRSIKLKELNFAFQYNKLSEYPIELT
ncbi:MAG: hypothetical protein D8M25_06430 [Bacteroidetes bacterium]|nr:hypothetical protein [Bacteroidota bacterium]